MEEKDKLRDDFAKIALSSILNNMRDFGTVANVKTMDDVAELAYSIADTMMAERNPNEKAQQS